MPQKPVFSRPPILTVPHCFPAAGTVRSMDERITRLYEKACKYLDRPILWEGLFKVACLVKNKPAEEPVGRMIRNMIAETESGAFSGTIFEQICVARAAMSLFEYSAERTILKRISGWLRYIEIEWDDLIIRDGILYRPADLMELLVRYYLASGTKSSLRLCARLRAESFDWTTALHTFQQTIPIRSEKENNDYGFPSVKPEEIDYTQKEKLINHSEMLADGVRYTLYAGLFSGHRQDLSAGKTVWSQLIRHHRALCGGTTGDPFLSGNAADQPVNNMSLAAWTEAFGAQMILPDFPWAADEMIRIIRNGLDDCLSRNEEYRTQRVNTIRETREAVTDPAAWFARMTRAVSAAYRYAVSLTEKGLRINYTMPGKYLFMSRKQPLILRMDSHAVCFQCKEPVSVPLEIYLSPLCSYSVRTIRDRQDSGFFSQEERNSCCILTDAEWHDQDRVLFDPDEKILCEDTHHQGAAFIKSGRLLCMPSDSEGFARAVCGHPACKDDRIVVYTAKAEKWRIRNDQPADIPVLPDIKEEPVLTVLKYYSDCPFRITMFPRAK